MLSLARRGLFFARRPLSLIPFNFVRAEYSKAGVGGAAAQPRKLFEKEERRLDLDRQARTRQEYIEQYGQEFGVREWDAAVGRRFVELRFDSDGEAYTKEEVLDYWAGGGSSDREGVAYVHWDACKHFAHQMTISLKQEQRIGDMLDLYLKYDLG